MIQLKLFSLLLLLNLGYCSKQRKYLMDPGFSTPDGNIQCPYLRQFSHARENGDTITNRLRLESAVIVQMLVIDTAICHADRDLIERNFSIHYEDATDILKQETLYSDSLVGRWGGFDARIEIMLDPVLYTDHVILSSSAPIQCSSILVYGCTPFEICPPGTCKNNGTCIGNGRCACQKGFMGKKCEVPVSKMSFDDYEIVAATPKLLLTKDAAFDVSGDVLFAIPRPVDQTRQSRSYHSQSSAHHGNHGNSAHFHGNGGSCYHSSLHNGGYSSSGHATYGHHPSNSHCSSVLTSPTGYSHTAHISYGYNHNPGGTHYIYTTHGTSHHSHGASLHYSNNQLCMHVHNSHNDNHNGNNLHEHYQVVAPFNPKPDVTYNVCSSYSPHNGACIYVNGHPVASQTKPTYSVPTTTAPAHYITTVAPTLPPTQGPLCFGSCGAQSGGCHHNYSMSNIGIAGGCVRFLANNMLLGLLGVDMINLLHNKVPTPKPAPTTSVPQTTTQPPASATTGQQTGAATSKYDPVCYDCVHINNTGSCSKVMQCNHGDVCLILHDQFGYTQRCMNKQDCEKGTSTILADCWNCCYGNLCNDRCIRSSRTSASCQDKLVCISLTSLGAYYNVCADPVYSTTVCQKSCGHCP